jgi:hypothetical protein
MKKTLTLVAVPVFAVLTFALFANLAMAASCTLPQVSCDANGLYDALNGSCVNPYCTSDAQCAALFGATSQCIVAQQGCANTCTLVAGGGGTGVVTPTSTNSNSATLAINGSMEVNGTWQLTATGPASTPFTLCAQQTLPNGGGQQPESCTPNFGFTQATGGWSSLGTFPASSVGTWNEWVIFQDANQEKSPQITFTVGPAGSIASSGGGTTSGGTVQGNPNLGTVVPYLDAIIAQLKQAGNDNLTAFIDYPGVMEGVTDQPNAAGVAAGIGAGGVSGDYATEATAQALAQAFTGSASNVVSEPAPPGDDPVENFVTPSGVQNPPQLFVQFSDGTLMNAGGLAQDYFQGAADIQVKLNERLTDITKSYTQSPQGSPITWQPDPSFDYSSWFGTDAQGYTWSIGSNGTTCELVAWEQYGLTFHANPAPYEKNTTANTIDCDPETGLNSAASMGPGNTQTGTNTTGGGQSGGSLTSQNNTGGGTPTNLGGGGAETQVQNNTISSYIASLNSALANAFQSISSVTPIVNQTSETSNANSSEAVLTALEASLQSIQNAIAAGNGSISADTLSSMSSIVQSISQIIQLLSPSSGTVSSSLDAGGSLISPAVSISTPDNPLTARGTQTINTDLAVIRQPISLPTAARATLAISVANSSSGIYPVGSSWTLQLTGGPINESFTICDVQNGVQNCTPNWGTTDASGSWESSGNFTSGTEGIWTEWVQFAPPSKISNKITFTVAPTGNSATTGTDVGVYIWGGNYTGAPAGSLLSTSVALAAQNGFHVVRITLDPRYNMDYNISSACYPNFTLEGLASSPQYKTAFGTPGIDTFMLTAYDGASFGDCVTKKYLSLSALTPDLLSAIQTEYENLGLYLYRTYQGTGKTFIISNWESDNDAYCGSSYNYLTSSTFQTTCNANYSSAYGGNTGPRDTMAALTKWFTARQAGITAARVQAASEGDTDVAVYQAPEFNSVNALQEAGYPSVLYNVLPNVSSDYISYSSYESINKNPSTLVTDLATIHQVAGPTQVIIGEFGFDSAAYGDAGVATKMAGVVSDMQDSSVPYGIAWQMFDQPGGDFGIFNIGADNNVEPLPQEKVLMTD